MQIGTLVKVFNHNDETAVIVYRDENHVKRKIVKTDMMVDYYLLNEGKQAGLFIKQEDTTKFETPYTQLVESIVENLDHIDPVYKQKAEAHLRFLNYNMKGGYDRLKKNILKIPGLYAADEPLENRAIEWFYNNYEEDLSYNPSKYTAFFDIETDLMLESGGKKKRNGAIDLINTPDPVNIITLYYNDIIHVFALNYGTKNPSFKKFIENFSDKKEAIRQKIYERNNRSYTRGRKTLTGKEIKLEDIKLNLYSSENELIRAFFHKVHELDPDFLFAWNMSFDVRTLFGRLEVTQREILRREGEKVNKWQVKEWTQDFIADPKYTVDEYGNTFSPRYYYFITDEGKFVNAGDRRDYMDICDGINWLDQLVMHSILNVNNASDSDALDAVSDEMYQIGKVEFPMGMDIFNVAWKDYELFFEYSIQDVMLLKKIEEELHNATEVFELSALYKCLPKDAFSQTKSTKSFMGYEAKKRGYVLRNNINAVNSWWKDRADHANNDFNTKFGLDIRRQLIQEIAGGDHELYHILMDRDTHGGFVSETVLNTNKNGIVLYGGIKSNALFANAFDKDFSSLYPSTKHALSIDDDGAIARYAIYDKDIMMRQREKEYHKAYVWKSKPKQKDIQDHWAITDEGHAEDQNLMIRLYDMLVSKTYSKLGEEFLGLPNTTDLITDLIKSRKRGR